MRKELPKTYEPQEVEGKIYQSWMDAGCFKAAPNPDKKPFCIVMPPPNVTGQLHMGHAMDATLQDILIRYKRMQGYEALWMPGTDHAGIATQIKVEEELRKNEGLTRYDLGREKFLERVWDWKHKYGDRIVEQQKKLGASCDWDRARFTMDEGCSRAVREAFCELYDKGLIYKGSRIINWCPHCLTALSDAEVEYQDKPGHLWYIRYPLADGSGDLVVATTRPETMMGDTGVAVNPEDERFKHLVGKTCILPIMNREIPIVADEYVELGFGTGAVKMTPAHDPNDFRGGPAAQPGGHPLHRRRRKINENGGPYNGMDRYECRKAIVKDLEEQGYLIKTEDYSHNVGTLLPLPQRRGAPDLRPVVREDGPPGQRGPPGGQTTGRSNSSPSGSPRPTPTGWRTSTTGASPASSGGGHQIPRLDLRRLRPHHRGPHRPHLLRQVRQQEHHPGGGRAGHLV